MAPDVVNTAVELADAIELELGCDDFRSFVLKQKLDAKAFAAMRVERLERFCIYSNDGRPSDQITEGDLAKLEALQKKMRITLQAQSCDNETDLEGLAERTDEPRLSSSAPEPRPHVRASKSSIRATQGKRSIPSSISELTEDELYKRTSRCDDLSSLIGKGNCEELRRMFDLLKENFDEEFKALKLDEGGLKRINFQSDPQGLQLRDEVCTRTMQETNNGRLKIAGRVFHWPRSKSFIPVQPLGLRCILMGVRCILMQTSGYKS